jgi:septal ring factor EnvC (AmiA/AmiB activator)
VLTAFFLKRVTTYDRSLLLRARELHRAHEWERETLAHLRIVQSVLHRTIQERSFEVAKAAESQRALLRRADAHAARVEAELSALKEEATRVEKVVAALTSGSGAESPGEPNLKGLARGLQLPAKGVLVSGFGKHKVPGYNEYVFHKGLEYSTTPGSLVTSVARGVVRYAGPMPGYGKVLIIDHGRRDYSLYGRLGKIIVKIGQGVGVGEVVGVTGSPDRRNRNFYFEIRRGGTPRNPINYLINNGEDRARS